jgi:diphosphoinositol-polyphosphate diphosphatase
MITSQRGEGLLFPKGGWETDETVEEAACREALEEAGVRGLLQVLVCMVSTSILVQG